MKRKDVLHSPKLLELKKKRRQTFFNKILLSLIAFSAIFAGLVFVSRLDKLNIFEIEVIGNKVVETELIKEVVKNNLEGYYLWFLPKSNFLLLPKNKIKNELTVRFKRLKDISFDLGNTGVLSVSFSEREGKYIWCGENLPEAGAKSEESSCYFVDESGYVFDQAPYFSGEVYFKFFGPVSDSYFSPDLFEKIIVLKENLSNMGMKPTSLYIKNDGDMEIYLSSNKMPPDAPKIIFKDTFEAEKLSENLQAALATEPLQSDFKNKYSSLLYIDLRYGNKVYYKFQ